MKKRTRKITAAILLILIVLFYSIALPKNAYAQDFGYTGGAQTFTATVAGNYQLEVWGAQGSGNPSGLGGYSVGGIVLAANETLYIYVGSSSGFNGGGIGSSNGGGGTDIRRYGTSLGNRVIIGGGGGGGGSDYAGGNGGGLSGANGQNGSGATQSAGGAGTTMAGGVAGSLGQGGSPLYGQGGGGGGGYFGGGSGTAWHTKNGSYTDAGGGGSGYIGGVKLGTMQTGVQPGNGYVRVTKVSNTPYPDVQTWGYGYIGAYQTFTAAFSGTYKLDAYGAQGGNYSASGGAGGASSGTIWLSAGQSIYLYVGGAGSIPTPVPPYGYGVSGGGFNGGGNTAIENSSQSGPNGGTYLGAGGGGASDVRTSVGNLSSRIIVAGGGGGSGSAGYAGGAGGGVIGSDAQFCQAWDQWGWVYHNYTGHGGTASTGGSGGAGGYTPVDPGNPGTFGVGGNAAGIGWYNTGWFDGSGGGGGGWYGGGAGSGGSFFGGGAGPAGGGGGSGYIGGVSGGTMSTGGHYGNGYIQITKIDTLPNAPIITSPTSGQVLTATHTPTITWNFSDPDQGDYQKYYQVVWSNNGFATWYGNSDVITSGNGSYTLPWLPDGTWQVAVKTWDQQGVSDPPWGYGSFTILSDTTPPTYSSAIVANIDANGYDVFVYGVADTQSGVNRVQFPTWTDYNGQDDIQPNWTTNPIATGTNMGGGTWKYHVAKSDHNNEVGQYRTAAYIWDNAGNYLGIGGLDAYLKLSQAAPSIVPIASSITGSTVVLTSSPGSMVTCNGVTLPSGSNWTGLSPVTGYTAYAFMPADATHNQSPNTANSPIFTTLKLDQIAPTVAPVVSNLTANSVILTSSAGSQITTNGVTKASGSMWTALSKATAYTAFAFMPADATHNQSPNSATTNYTTLGIVSGSISVTPYDSGQGPNSAPTAKVKVSMQLYGWINSVTINWPSPNNATVTLVKTSGPDAQGITSWSTDSSGIIVPHDVACGYPNSPVAPTTAPINLALTVSGNSATGSFTDSSTNVPISDNVKITSFTTSNNYANVGDTILLSVITTGYAESVGVKFPWDATPVVLSNSFGLPAPYQTIWTANYTIPATATPNASVPYTITSTATNTFKVSPPAGSAEIDTSTTQLTISCLTLHMTGAGTAHRGDTLNFWGTTTGKAATVRIVSVSPSIAYTGTGTLVTSLDLASLSTPATSEANTWYSDQTHANGWTVPSDIADETILTFTFEATDALGVKKQDTLQVTIKPIVVVITH